MLVKHVLELDMKKRVFWLLFSLILIIQFVVRVVPPQNYNFYFTVDQGNDAVHVREIAEYGRILTRGPETSMPGVFAGPLWYYFLGIGYKLFGGDPFGGIVMVILLSLGATAGVMWEFKKRISPQAALFAGLSLQGFWYFYEFSRYQFNPFPTALLSLWYVFWIIRFLEKSRRYYYLALIPIFLMFNCAVATAVVFLLFHFLLGLWGLYKKLLSLKSFLTFNIVLPGVITAHIVLQFAKQLQDSHFVNDQITGERGFFSGMSFIEMAARFLEILHRSLIPQNLLIGLVLFAFIGLLFWKEKKKDKFSLYFVCLSIALFTFSYLFFGSNKIWREWHTLFLYPLLFLSVFLMLISIKRTVGVILLVIIMTAQLFLFKDRYLEYLKSTQDPGILANQLSVLDWIYTHNEEDGFNAYTYSPHVFDYQNQYLFWWYGRQKYGFVPCEYSLYPGFMKYNYVRNAQDYAQPTLGCDNLRFVIIEPGGDEKSHSKWREQIKFERGGKVDETEVNKFKIEKWWIRPRTE